LSTADVAFLLVSSLDSNVCGIAYFDTTSHPFGLAQHKCARGRTLTFAHEVSHIIGANHNREVVTDGTDSAGYAYGFLLHPDEKNAHEAGARTVMS
jgi:hypothetical protein